MKSIVFQAACSFFAVFCFCAIDATEPRSTMIEESEAFTCRKCNKPSCGGCGGMIACKDCGGLNKSDISEETGLILSGCGCRDRDNKELIACRSCKKRKHPGIKPQPNLLSCEFEFSLTDARVA